MTSPSAAWSRCLSAALVLVVEQAEVDRDAVAQPVEDVDHALGVVGTVVHA